LRAGLLIPTARSELAFNVGGTWKLNEHLNLLFSRGRDTIGDTHAMTYIGLQLLRNETERVFDAQAYAQDQVWHDDSRD
jgi:hypothetical protein